jgi:acetylornithine deacetylase/succinyl-diaminopimelate desuccinylase-like protein
MIRRVMPSIAATILIAMSAFAGDLPPAPQPPDAVKVVALGVLKNLVETNTTHAHGSTGAAEQLAARLRAAGFAPEDVTLIAPADHPTKRNVVIQLRGQGKGKPLLFIGHLDVVEAKREDWSVDPFVLTAKDGYFYGRGTFDMKGDDAALVTNLMRFKQEGFVPERDIVVALTADEEACISRRSSVTDPEFGEHRHG